jgi:drug/metabolite transporter (DMT)-like permease
MHEPPESIRRLWPGVAAAFIAALIGAGWQLASRHGVTTTLGPLELALLRYGIPAVVLLPLLCRTGLWPPTVPRTTLALLVAGGGLPFGLLALAGAAHAPAAHMGVFLAGTMPLFSALAAWLALGEGIAGARWAGLGLIAAGVFSLALHNLVRVDVASAWFGDLLFLLAAALWAVYGVAFRRAGLTPWQAVAVVNAWSLLLLLPLLAWRGVPRLWTAPWRDIVLQLLWQGGLAGLLGLLVYTAAVSRLGPSRAALSGALVPLLSAAGGAWLLGEVPSPVTMLLIGVVVCGVALASGAFGRRLQAL